MTKAKFLVLLFAFVILILGLPTVVNATTVEYTRTIPSNDGTIKLNFTGLELDVAKAYEFALVRQGGIPENWFSIDDGYTQNSASITLSSATGAITNVLKATDTGFIYIREKDDTTDSYILEAYQVDLKLPYLKSLIYTKTNSEYDLTTARLYGVIGNNYIYTGGNQTYIYWEKVTDEEIIEDYLNIKNNNGAITSLESSLPNPPEEEYMAARNPNYTSKNDGLYLLWVYRTAENCKSVYSCIVHDGLEEATTVEQYIQSADVEAPKMETLEIENTSSLKHNSETGYYFVDSGKTITIKATFDEVIYGNTAPTLKIKCGNGEEITVPAGTITGQYIIYNYTIKEQDKGIIAAVSMTGGDVADEDGNAVTGYTCPVLGDSIWNDLVYANGSGVQTNPGNDDEQVQNPEEIDDNKETFGNHTYSIITKKMSWQEAKEYCESLGGYLVTITSEQEQAFIASFIREKGFTQNRFWMGATDKDKEGTWKWITGEKFSYINWGTAQPNNNETGGQDYGVYVGINSPDFGVYAGKWDDINEGSEEDIYFICEWGDVEKETTTDSTTSPIILPNTGLKIGLVLLLVISLIGIIAYLKSNKLKGI